MNEPKASQQSVIAQEFEKLDKAINVAGNRLTDLISRLQPCLKPEEPMPSGQECDKLPEACCQIAEMVRQARMKIEIIANDIANTIQRLQI